MAKGKVAGVSKGLKGLFAVHGIISLLSGFPMFLVPFKWGALNQYNITDEGAIRLIGAFLLALGFKDWFCFRAKGWGDVRIIVIQEIALTILGTLAFLYIALRIAAPMFVWVNLVVFAVLALAWIYFYIKHR